MGDNIKENIIWFIVYLQIILYGVAIGIAHTRDIRSGKERTNPASFAVEVWTGVDIEQQQLDRIEAAIDKDND